VCNYRDYTGSSKNLRVIGIRVFVRVKEAEESLSVCVDDINRRSWLATKEVIKSVVGGVRVKKVSGQ